MTDENVGSYVLVFLRTSSWWVKTSYLETLETLYEEYHNGKPEAEKTDKAIVLPTIWGPDIQTTISDVVLFYLSTPECRRQLTLLHAREKAENQIYINEARSLFGWSDDE